MIENDLFESYFSYCKHQKNLDDKTLKSYRIDLEQFIKLNPSPNNISRHDMEQYIEFLVSHYKPSTAKRKISSLRAYYRYLVYEEILEHSPFEKIQLHIRQESVLPRTIDRQVLGAIFSAAYESLRVSHSPAVHKATLRDIAVLELLFSSGVRVSELCNITCGNLNFETQVVLIKGKGNRERQIYLASSHVIKALKDYYSIRSPRFKNEPYFFLNRDGKRLSDQSVRRIINRYVNLAQQSGHYTPHMFRHSFATYLWDMCGDIYEVKEILGHSSVKTTERYVHASFERQKRVLSSSHPRSSIKFIY